MLIDPVQMKIVVQVFSRLHAKRVPNLGTSVQPRALRAAMTQFPRRQPIPPRSLR